MSIFPVNTYSVRSRAKPSEIVAGLSRHVQPFPYVRVLPGRIQEHKAFWGTISETGFRLVRISNARNSFRPTIYGSFSSDSEFTILRITIKHGVYFFISMIFVFLVAVLAIYNVALLPLLVALFSNRLQDIQTYLSPPYSYYLLVPFAALFFGYFLNVAFFESEAHLAERELSKILEPFFIKTDTSVLSK
jgi:hypothetical protein